MVAGGVLCGAAVTLAALLASSADLMTAARYRSHAAIVACAKIEELLATALTGGPLTDGTDAVDDHGVVTAPAVGSYLRQWHLVPVAAHPDRLMVLEVDVSPRVPGGLHAGGITLTALVEQRP